jgi:hypothetical protein
MNTILSNTCDVQDWLYSDIVKDHFFNPRNILLEDKDYIADGIGISGSPLCGDMMAVWIKKFRKLGLCSRNNEFGHVFLLT